MTPLPNPNPNPLRSANNNSNSLTTRSTDTQRIRCKKEGLKAEIEDSGDNYHMSRILDIVATALCCHKINILTVIIIVIMIMRLLQNRLTNKEGI